ncbi:MAG: DUF885 domain-containing protein [Candidatus Zixiibacteriota bacterium]
MLRQFTLAAALLILLALSAQGASSKKKAVTVDEIGGEIMGALEAFDPVNSTSLGIHEYDGKFADYSGQSVKLMVNRLKQFESRLSKLDKTTPPGRDLINLKLLHSDVRTMLVNLDNIQWHKKSPQLYVDQVMEGMYLLMLSQHATTEKKLPSILSRMRSVPALLATALANIKRPPAVWIQLSKNTIDDASKFYGQVASDLANQFPKRSAEIAKAANAARTAMNDFRVALEKMTPGDDKGFAIGEGNFTYLLQNQYFMNITADSLLHLGEALLDSAQIAYRSYKKLVEEKHQNGEDSVFAPASFSRQDILDYYNWEAKQVRTYLKLNEIITVPDYVTELSVVETPSVLRSVISGIAYQPAGPFDQIQKGLFYVRPLPDSMDRAALDARYRFVQRRGFKGSVVHEGYPGHHLQMQIAAHNLDPIRKFQMNMMMIEGWALYSEEVMYRTGLYGAENPAQWLGVLGGIRFRAARIVADVKLHTGQFTYDECVGWMIKTLDAETESDEQYLRKEVQRYTYRPTVQMSYLMGKREIEKLRDAAQKKEGNDFLESRFYDNLLAEGSIPPALMWEVMNLNQPK